MTMNRCLTAAFLVVLAGCAQRTICPQKSSAEIVSAVTTLAAAEGMEITLHHMISGMLEVSTPEQLDPATGISSSRHWSFAIKDGLLGAYARVDTKTLDAAGRAISSTQTFYSETAPADWKWFWNVRRGLEQTCGIRVDFLKL